MKTYELKPTKHPDVFRVVDRDGEWQHYFIKSKNLYPVGVTTILNRGYAKGAFFEQWLSQHTAEERDQILRSAGERGDKVHRAIDGLLSWPEESTLVISREEGFYNRETKDYEPLSNDEWDALLSFNSFWAAHAPVILTSEATVYNTSYGYAGTTDAILILTKACGVKTCKCEPLIGKIGLWDWKTSSGIRASYSAQIAAYAFSENLAEYLPAGKIVPDYTAILRVGTNHKTTGGYEMKAFTFLETQANFHRFIAAKEIADFEFKPFDPETDIEEIPDTIQFTVQKFDFEKAKVEAKAKTNDNAKGIGGRGQTARASEAEAGN